MNNPRIKYFEQEDVLHLVITEEPEMIGVEILHASSFLRDAVLDSIQARTLQLIEAGA
jgi:hypothetical protein